MTRQLLGLHLRSFEEPLSNTRMPVEQGGTAGHCHEHYLGSRSSVPLPLHLPPTTQQSPYGGEYAKMEAWMDENPEFVQDYFIRFGWRAQHKEMLFETLIIGRKFSEKQRDK